MAVSFALIAVVLAVTVAVRFVMAVSFALIAVVLSVTVVVRFAMAVVLLSALVSTEATSVSTYVLRASPAVSPSVARSAVLSLLSTVAVRFVMAVSFALIAVVLSVTVAVRFVMEVSFALIAVVLLSALVSTEATSVSTYVLRASPAVSPSVARSAVFSLLSNSSINV